MHIKALILDGFKSYRSETVLDQFDRQFNAITGSNGSGKSNILDSICFVLGENNMIKVRRDVIERHFYVNPGFWAFFVFHFSIFWVFLNVKMSVN